MSPPLQLYQKIEIKIDSLAFGNGAGVGRFNDFVVFVSDCVPGEVVEVEISKVKKSFAEARLLRTLEPSAFRRRPPCAVATTCGGCSWQQVEYSEQLKQKQMLFEKTLGKFAPQANRLKSIIASPNEFHYRNRIQIHKKGPLWGFLKRKSSEIVDINECWIADAQINKYIQTLKTSSDLPQNCRIEISQLPNGQVTHFLDRGDIDLIGFSQVNEPVNQLLTQQLLKIVEKLQPTEIYDLYAGNGNFSFPFTEMFKATQVVSVELNTKAHREAAKRLSLRPEARLQLVHSKVEDYLKNQSLDSGGVGVIDPPRAGLQPNAVELLIDSQLKNIVYVSCDLQTLQRDLRLFENEGFQLIEAQPFDMFPQTPHMEVLCLIHRS